MDHGPDYLPCFFAKRCEIFIGYNSVAFLYRQFQDGIAAPYIIKHDRYILILFFYYFPELKISLMFAAWSLLQYYFNFIKNFFTCTVKRTLSHGT